MVDLSVNFMGLKLKNPIIIGSSGLTNSVEKVKDLENFGAAAVVLKSIFEEQIIAEAAHLIQKEPNISPEMNDYLHNYIHLNTLSDYIKLIKACKAECNIPIIASINCVSKGEWLSFARQIEQAGADALELNVSLLPSNDKIDGVANEQVYFDIIESVRKAIKIPIALKMSYFSGGLAHLIKKISWTKNVNSIVLFNRFYSPDIDIQEMKIVSTNVFSRPDEISTSLRWIALTSKSVNVDLVASTGVHDGAGVIKQLLAGATAVEIASTIYKNGTDYLQAMIHEMEMWMEKKKYKTIDEFRGKMAFDPKGDLVGFERIQFMKYFSGME